MARKPSKPRKTEAQLEADRLIQRAHDLEAVNVPPDAATLPRQADIEITRAGQKRDDQKVKENSARRLDAFAALKDGMVQGGYDALRRYELQLLVRRGENDRGPSKERVDRTAGFTTDAMIDAAKWIDEVNERISPRDWWLLAELIAPSIDRGTWRATVAWITGEENPHAQCAAVRALAVNVRDAAIRADKHLAGGERRAA